MSGSSLDGLDIALCQFHLNTHEEAPEKVLEGWSILKAETYPYHSEWLERLRNANDLSGVDFYLQHVEFGRFCGEKVKSFLKGVDIVPDYIASHGHTTHHLPEKGLTIQIGCGATLAALCEVPVINDFRMMDVAMGGQGAPLAPLADKYLFGDYDFFLNLGGIANISAKKGDELLAFDICGANQVLNALTQLLNKPYDEGGKLAASGQLNKSLLDLANQKDFYQQAYPKSLSNDWVRQHHTQIYLDADLPVNDRLNTACIQIAQLIAKEINNLLKDFTPKKEHYKLLVTGGGAYNNFLINCIQEACATFCNIEIIVPDQSIIEFKEAALMSLLGLLRLRGQPNCLSSVTGARKNVIGGAVHLV